MSRRQHYEMQYGKGFDPKKGSKSEFPSFHDADVKIIISGSRQYTLHSNILKEISPVMRELLADEYSAKLTSKAIKKGVTVRSRLVAVKNPQLDPDRAEIEIVLEPVVLDSDGKPTNSEGIGLDLENGLVVPPVYAAYHNVFGAFYNRPIDIGDFARQSTLSNILEASVQVTMVAEYLECVHIITKPIEATLLATGQTLYRSIVANPAAWINFAYRIRSGPIFREALIHAAGQFNTDAMQKAMQTGMAKSVAAVIEKKGNILKEGVKMSQLKMLSYYPPQLQRELKVGLAEQDSIGRASYSNDIMTWIALVAFRHIIGQNVAMDKTHHAPDMGFEQITKINEGGDRYLGRNELQDFHHLFPMTGKGSAVVENRLADIKEHVKRFVHGLMKNNSQLNIKEWGQEYFTCTNIDWLDYPWIAEEKTKQAAEMEEEGVDDIQTVGSGDEDEE